MTIRNRIAAALSAGAMIGGSLALAVPAHAENIPSTYNRATQAYYSYVDSSNRFCVSRPAGAPIVGVDIHLPNGNYLTSLRDTTANGVGKCVYLDGMPENRTFMFKLFNSKGKTSVGHVVS